MATAAELVSQGYGGYQGWSDPEAGYDFAATGGAGKKTTGGGGSPAATPVPAQFVGEVNPAEVPSTLDYITKLGETEDLALNDLMMAMKARRSPLDVYQELETAAGLPQLRGTAISLSKEIGNIEDTLGTIEPDVAARSRESLMTEAQRRGTVTARKEPFLEKLGKFTTDLGRIGNLIGMTGQEIGTKVGLYTQGEQMKLEPLQLKYTALVDRHARQISGFSEDKQTQLEILFDKINRQRQLSDQEWALANQLGAEKREYTRALQTAAASAGYKVTGQESDNELLTQIGTKATEQISFERAQATKGTAGEKAIGNAKTALANDAKKGANFEDVVRRYSDVLSPYEIRQIYNSSSIYGPAKETEAQVQTWTLSPETVYKSEAAAKESEGKIRITRPDGSIVEI